MECNDKIRAWYDARECGSLSKSHPFQAALCTSGLLPTKRSESRLEQHLIGLRNSASKTRKLSIPYTELHESEQKVFSLSRVAESQQGTASIAYGVALADDLYASNEALSKIMLKAQAEEMERFKESFQSRIVADASQYRPSAPTGPTVSTGPVGSDVDQADQPPSSVNKFRTAKDQFTSEGGQLKESTNNPGQVGIKRAFSNPAGNGGNQKKSSSSSKDDLPPLPPELENFDRELVDKIIADIIDKGQPVKFSDISGLEFAKKCVTELICWPMTRPDLFKGLRALPRGLLLFGPPGTGKTLIGKAIAHQSGATFFSISASSLMSKWIGEGEKTVRTLFAVAAYRQPSVVFIDEVDSLLCQRSSDENEATRRIKTEFMVQLDGAGTNQTARVVIVGATNRPEELDEAVRRRFVKRIYIPLPDPESRRQLLMMLLGDVVHSLESADCEALVKKTDGYSGADIRSLCQEASMGPVREMAVSRSGDLQNIDALSMPPISLAHFDEAFDAVMPSVSAGDLHRYVEWNNQYGSFRRMV